MLIGYINVINNDNNNNNNNNNNKVQKEYSNDESCDDMKSTTDRKAGKLIIVL